MDTEKAGQGFRDRGNSADLEEIHVIHNVRPARRGAGGLLLLLILVLGLIGAGYYYFFYIGASDGFAGIKAEKGNLLALCWSFETGGNTGEAVSDLWGFDGGIEPDFNMIKRDAHSGRYAIQADLSEGGTAQAVYIPVLEIQPRRQYTAEAWVKVTGGAMVALKAGFAQNGSDLGEDILLYTDEFVSDRERTGEYIKISGTLIPPPEAKALRFYILAGGQGKVVVDDVALFEAAANTRDQLGTAGAIDFFPCGGGYLVQRIDHTLFVGGRVVAVESSGEVVDDSEGRETTVHHDSGEKGFNPQGEGYLYAGAKAGLIRASSGLEVSAGKIQGTLDVSPTETGTLAEIRYCFDLIAPYAKTGVGVLSGGEFNLYGTSFGAVQGEALIFGDEHDRIKIIFDRAIPVMGMLRKDGGLRVQCVFQPDREIRLAYQILSDFTEETKAAYALLQQATRAQESERYGEALENIYQIISRYPYNPSVMERSESLRTSILAVKRERLTRIQEQLRSAEFLNTPEQFSTLETLCRSALTQFPGDRDFKEALQSVRSKGSHLMDRLRDHRAERLFLLAKNLNEAGDRDYSFSEILQYLQTTYPDTEWTESALNLKGMEPSAGEPKKDASRKE
ncbi:MAG: hypothetical protein KJ645_04645 [Planctomycetes bacterium]|nr:hypothetical protein [Planctomycetota bacterium]